MKLDPLTALFDLGKTAIEKIWPDPAVRAAQLLELEKVRQTGDLADLNAHVQMVLGQVEINKIEAASDDKFKSRWRPAIGWTCAISLFSYYVPYCLVATFIWAMQCIQTGTLVQRPDLGIADLVGLTAAMLGIAGMRTTEKLKGVI